MENGYRARWVSKDRADALRKTGRGSLINSQAGFIVVEPVDSQLGDGQVLSTMEADFEIRPTWCLEKTARLRDARRQLGLVDVAV